MATDPVNREENTKEEDQKRFSEQCFLLDFFKKFTSFNKNHNYSNFIQITQKGTNPSVLLNKLLGSNIEAFLDITPGQLSLLQPKIRLFKEHAGNGKEYIDEFIFDDHFNKERFETIVQNQHQRGSGVGLKKFEWEDMGTNPGDTGKAFSATLQLHFSSIEDLFYPQKTDSQLSLSFADLIRTPPAQYDARGVQDDRYFRLLVKVGWQAPPNNSLESIASFNNINTGVLRKAIDKMTITLFLTLTNHNFNFKEDGTIELTATYVGAIEGKFLSPEADILYVGKSINKQLEQLNNSITQEQARKDILEKKTGFFSRHFWRGNEELELEGLNESLEERNTLKENIIRENKSRSYQRLLDAIEKQDRLYFVNVSKEQIQIFNQINSILQDGNLSFDQVNAKVSQFRNNTKLSDIQPQSYNSTNFKKPKTISNIKKEIQKDLESKTPEDLEKNITAQDGKINYADTAKSPAHIRINYVYLGDLIEAAMKVLYDNSNIDSIKDKELDQGDLKNKFRILLGTIEIYDPITNKSEVVDLCDIPISLNLFHSWFLRKVIRPQLSKYLLRDFLRDLCAELLLNALSPVCLGGAAKAIQNRVSFSIFTLPSKQTGSSPFAIFPANKRINVDELDPDTISFSSNANDDLSHYLMIYISGYAPEHLTGNLNEDLKNGIYHFRYGSDRGIVKNIQFSKTDMPYLKESRITSPDLTRKGDLFLSEPYNAKMTLWGNTIFKPGMSVYLEPSSFGMGKSIPKTQQLPIGGYYQIIKAMSEIAPGLFITTLDLNYLNSGDENKEQTIQNISNVQSSNSNNSVSINSIPTGQGLR